MNNLPLGEYEHYKGKRYQVVGHGVNEADLAPLVFYRPLYHTQDFPPGTVWVRTVKNFTETVEYNGATKPRFRSTPPKMPIALIDLFHLGICPFLVFMLDFSLNLFVLGWYTKYHGDTYTHFLGGMAIAYSASYAISLAEKNNLLAVRSRFIKAWMVVALVMMTAVLWESWEFWHDFAYGTHFQPSNWDTMKDLIMGTLGGLTFCLSFLRRKK